MSYSRIFSVLVLVASSTAAPTAALAWQTKSDTAQELGFNGPGVSVRAARFQDLDDTTPSASVAPIGTGVIDEGHRRHIQDEPNLRPRLGERPTGSPIEEATPEAANRSVQAGPQPLRDPEEPRAVPGAPGPSGESNATSRRALPLASPNPTNPVQASPVQASPVQPNALPTTQTRGDSAAAGTSSIRPEDSGESRRASDESRPAEYRSTTTTPSVTVDVQGPEEANLGEDSRYEIVVTNSGEYRVEDVVLDLAVSSSMPLVRVNVQPEIVSGLYRFTVGDLAPDEARRIVVVGRPTERGPVSVATRVSLSSLNEFGTQVREPKIESSIQSPGTSILAGTQFTIPIELTNGGDGVSSGIRVVPRPAPGVRILPESANAGQVGTLRPGEQKGLVFKLVAEQTGQRTLEFEVEVEGQRPQVLTARIDVVLPRLEVSVDGPEINVLGEEGMYQVVVTNSGASAATDVQVRVAIPEHLKLTAMERDAIFDADTRILSHGIERLESERRLTFRFKAIGVTEGVDAVVVDAKSRRSDVARKSFRTEVFALADLKLEVADQGRPLPVGADAVISIGVSNQGTKLADNVRLKLELPAGLEARSGNGYEIVDGNIVFESLGLDAAKETILKIEATGIQAGTHVVRALMVHESGDNREIIAEDNVILYDTDRKRVAERVDR